MPGTSGLPLAGVEAIVEGLSAFQGDIRQMNSAMDSIQPRQTLLQRGFSALTGGIADFGRGILQWGVDTLANFGQSILHVAEVALGVLLRDAIRAAIDLIKDLASATIEAGSEFQTLELRLNGMNLQAVSEQQLDYVDATEAAVKMTKEQLDWLQRLAATTPFDNTDISNVYTLARSYGFADEEARELTETTSDFTASMGLSGEVLERVIHNFGQMVARGKITSTEIRDLARGAFLPVNDILQRIADNLNKTGQGFEDNSADIQKTKEQIEDYSDKLKILQQRQSEWTDKTKESTKMTLLEQMEELQEKIDKARGKLSALQSEAASPGQLTIADVTKKIQSPEGLPAQLFIDAFNEMIREEPRFTGAAERMARTFKAAADNAMDIVKSIGGLNIVKPILDVIGARIARFVEAFTGTERWDKLVAAANRVGQALSWIVEDLFSFLPDTESLADKTIEAVNRLADWLNEHRMDIATFFRNAYDFIKDKFIPIIGRAFNYIKNAVLAFIDAGFGVEFLNALGFDGKATRKIMDFVDGIRATLDRISEWYTENGPLIQEFFKTVGEIVTEFISDLTGGGKGEGDATGDILDGITKFMQFVIDHKDQIVKWVEILWSVFAVWQVLATIWNVVIGVMIALAGVFLTIVTVATSVKVVLVLLGAAISGLLVPLALVGAAVALGMMYWDLFKKTLITVKAAIDGFVVGFKQGWAEIKEATEKNIAAVVAAINNRDWVGLGVAIISGLVQGILLWMGTLANAMITALVYMVDAAMSYLGVHSPSTLFAGVGASLMEGLAQGIIGGIDGVVGAVAHITSVVAEKLNHAISVAEEKMNHLASLLGGGGIDFSGLGIGVSTAWAYGINQGIGAGEKAGRDMAEQTTRAARKKLKARSPSKLFEDLGMDTVFGFAQGIERATGAAVGAMRAVMGAATVPAMSSMAVARAAGNTYNNTRTANLTINTSAPVEPIVQDYHMLESMMGV